MTEPTPGADASSETPIDKLRTLRAKATSASKRTRATKRTVAKKTAPAGPGRPRAPRYGDKLVGWAKLGVPLVTGHPVRQAILFERAAALGPIIDRLAAEDPRVAQALERLSGLFGRGGAWAELGGWAVSTAGALALTTGYAHPILAMLCGGMVEQATMKAAFAVGEQEARAAGRVDSLGNVMIDPRRVEQIHAELVAGMRPAPADVERDDLDAAA